MEEKTNIYDGVIERLSFFKLDTLPEEISVLNYLISKVLHSINNITNQHYTEKTLPDDLYSIAVDKIAGEFLLFKKNSGNMSEIDFSPLEKQIQMGDTSITYAIEGVTSPEKRLDILINYLINGRDNELIRFRRLVW